MPDFELFREQLDRTKFRDVVNPSDGVTYPLISTDIPPRISGAVVERLRSVWPAGVNINTMFMRLSPAGVPVPHQAHTDSVMGRFSLMVYLNRRKDCRGGTSLLKHNETGMLCDPQTQAEYDAWLRDMNSSEKWGVIGMCPMTPNRAFIFPANRFHRAEPIGGFGKTAKTARLVLTAFFSEA